MHGNVGVGSAIGDHFYHMHNALLSDCAERREWLRKLAQGLLSDSVMADDVAQEAVLVALQHRGLIRVEDAWWRGVVHNLVANLNRRTIRRERIERECAASEVIASAAHSAERIEQEGVLSAAVLALDVPFRDVVVLRFYDGLKRREIAARLKLPIATVNSRLTRAMAKLREQLATKHDDERSWMLALVPLIAPGLNPKQITLGTLMTGKKIAVVATLAVCVGLVTTAVLAGRLSVPEEVSSVVAEVEGPIEGMEPSGGKEGVLRVPVEAESLVGKASPDIDLERPFVQVVDGVTGDPLPLAVVVRLDGREVSRTAREVAMRVVPGDGAVDWTRELMSMGTVMALDRQARFNLPEGKGPSAWIATHADLAGALMLSPRRGTNVASPRLELFAKNLVHVQVEAPDGSRQRGVPVGVFANQGGRRARASRPVLTDQDGKATLTWLEGMRLGTEAAFEVGFTFPEADGSYEVLSPSMSGSTITLTLPATGTVVVHATIDGVAVADGTPISLLESEAQFMQQGVRLTQGGAATFKYVGLGQSFQAGTYSTLAGRFTGPVDAGTVVHTDLAFLKHEFRARLLDHRGLAIANTDGDITWVDGQRATWYVFHSEGDGRILMSANVVAGTKLLKREVTVRLTGRKERILVDLPAAVDGSIDLGDIRFGTDQASVRGTVRDDTGQAVAGVHVEFVQADSDAPSGWTRLGRCAESDKTGRFKGPRLKVKELWIRALPTESLRHEPQLVTESGKTEIVMTSAASLKGRIETGSESNGGVTVHLWDEALGLPPPGTTSLRVGMRGGGHLFAHDSKWLRTGVDSSGGFEFLGLLGAKYTLAVSTGGGVELSRISLGQLERGKANRPARLQPFDIRPLVHTFRIDARDKKNRPVNGRVLLLAPKRNAHHQSRTHETVTVDRRDPIDTLVVVAPGFLREEVPFAPGEVVVQMERGIPIRLQIEGVKQSPGVEIWAMVSPSVPLPTSMLSPRARSYRWRKRINASKIGPDGSASLNVRRAGACKVRFAVVREGHASRWQKNTEGQEFSVQEANSVIHMKVDLSEFLKVGK